jgi:hypothetical protein
MGIAGFIERREVLGGDTVTLVDAGVFNGPVLSNHCIVLYSTPASEHYRSNTCLYQTSSRTLMVEAEVGVGYLNLYADN